MVLWKIVGKISGPPIVVLAVLQSSKWHAFRHRTFCELPIHFAWFGATRHLGWSLGDYLHAHKNLKRPHTVKIKIDTKKTEATEAKTENIKKSKSNPPPNRPCLWSEGWLQLSCQKVFPTLGDWKNDGSTWSPRALNPKLVPKLV